MKKTSVSFFIFVSWAVFLSSFSVLLSAEKPNSSKEKEQQARHLFQKGKTFYNQTLYKTAIDMFKKSASLEDKKDPITLKYIDLCQEHLLWKQKENEMLVDMQKKEIALEQENKLSLWIKQAINLYNQNHLKKALIQFEKVDHFTHKKNPIASQYIADIKEALDKEKNEQLSMIHNRKFIEKILDKSKKIKNLKNQALTLIHNGQFALALEYFKKVLALIPNDPLTSKYIRLCEENIAWEKKEQTFELDWNRRYFSKTNSNVQPHNKKIVGMIKEGQDLFHNEQYDDAEHFFQKLLKIRPNNTIIQNYLDLTQTILKKKKDLLHHQLLTKKMRLQHENKIKKTLEKLKQNQKLFEKGKKLFMQKHYPTALEIFDSLSKDSSLGNISTEYQNLCKHFIKNTNERLSLEKIFFKDLLLEKNITDLFNKGKSLYKSKNYPSCIRYMESILKQQPKHPFAEQYIILSQKQIDLQKESESHEIKNHQFSLKKTEKQIKTHHLNQFYSYIEQAKQLYKDQKYSKALELFQKAFHEDLPESVLLKLQNHIEQCFYHKKLLHSIKKNKELIKKKAKFDLLYKKAMTYDRMGEYSKELLLLNKISIKYPQYHNQKLTQAMKNCKNKKQIQDIEMIYNKGMSAYREKDWNKALQFFTDVYSHNSEFQDVYLYLRLTRKQLIS